MGCCLSSCRNTVPPTSFEIRYGMFGRYASIIDQNREFDKHHIHEPSVDSRLNTKKNLKKYTDTPRPDVIN
jgi:hypothetical protein